MIPAPYSRICVAKDLIDSYNENSEQLTEYFISNTIDDCLKQFTYMTLSIIERVFHVLIYEIIMKEEAIESETEFFIKQRELTLGMLKR